MQLLSIVKLNIFWIIYIHILKSAIEYGAFYIFLVYIYLYQGGIC